MITFRHRGSFDRSERFLERIKRLGKEDAILKAYAEQGLAALRSATPVDSGISSESWKYEIVRRNKGFSIYWTNDNVTSNGTPVVILLQYGHGTRSGDFIEGRDFINPAIRPIFERISENLWKEVKSL